MIRSHFNSITQILDSNGTPATDHSAIEQVFLNFYSNLWSNPSNISFVDILRALPSDLPRLFDLECLDLIHEVTLEEVFGVMQELPSSKSPGLDGFNAEFFCFFLVEH